MLQEAATLASLRVLSRAVPRGCSSFRGNQMPSWLQSQGGFLHWKDIFFNTIYTEGAGCQRDNWETPGENVFLLIGNGFLLPNPLHSERREKKDKGIKKAKREEEKEQPGELEMSHMPFKATGQWGRSLVVGRGCAGAGRVCWW